MNEGSWQQRRFFTADFLQQDPNAIAEKLIGLLSRKNSASGDTLKNAEHLYRGRQTRNILRDALPKAWYKILNDPDDLLVELLIETTEKLSGFRPEIEDVEKFIINIQTSPSTKSEVSSSPIKQAISPVSARKPISYPEGSFINKQVRSFQLLGNTHHPRTWKELLVIVSEEMYRRHTTEFSRCLSLRGSRMSYFSQQLNDLRQPMQIADSNFFVETHLNSNSIVKRSRELIRLFGYKESDLEVTAE